MIDEVAQDIFYEALPQWIPGAALSWLARHWPKRWFPETVRIKAKGRVFAEVLMAAYQAQYSTDPVKATLARQITDEGDIADTVSREICGGYGGPVFVGFEDGRWACYDSKPGGLILRTNPPTADELHRVGLLTDVEWLAQVLGPAFEGAIDSSTAARHGLIERPAKATEQ